MDDAVSSGAWQIDPETRTTLRIARIQQRIGERDFVDAILEAEELLDEVPRHAEGLFLLAEALLAAGDSEGARIAFEQHLEVTVSPSLSALTGLALSRFESCLLQGSVEASREALRLQPDNAEAHYTLGLALEFLDRKSEAVQCFVAAQQLDPLSFPLPFQLDDTNITDAVAEALGRLPEPLRNLWAGVPVALEERPDLAELRDNAPPLPPTICGFFAGHPDPEQPGLQPEALRLFRVNLERTGSWDSLVEQLQLLLEQEGLGWMGVEPSELADA